MYLYDFTINQKATKHLWIFIIIGNSKIKIPLFLLKAAIIFLIKVNIISIYPNYLINCVKYDSNRLYHFTYKK